MGLLWATLGLSLLPLTAYAATECFDAKPVADIAVPIATAEEAGTPIYLPAGIDRPGLYSGVRLNLAWGPAVDRGRVFKTYFDYDRDLLSTDYAIQKLEVVLYNGDSAVDHWSYDFTESCAYPHGREVRAGEVMQAAKIAANFAQIRFPRLRILVWGRMF